MEVQFKRVAGVVYAGIKPFVGRTKWTSMRTQDMRVAKRMAHDAKLHKLQAIENANALTDMVYRQVKGREIPTVDKAIAKYEAFQRSQGRASSTISGARGVLTQWMKLAGVADKLTTDVAKESFIAFFNPQDSVTLKTLTIRKQHCDSFCEFCRNEGFMNTNPSKGVGIDKTKLTQEQQITRSHPPITSEEYRKILSAVQDNTFWMMACLFGWEHGLRLSDVCLLEKVCVVDGKLRLMTRKTNTFVHVPLAHSISEAINANADGTQFLFPKQRAEYECFGSARLSGEFTALIRKAGVVGKSFHGFRTAFINRTYEDRQSTILDRIIAELAKRETAAAAGHRSTAATDIYLNAGKTNKHEQPERSKSQTGHGDAGTGGPLAEEKHPQPATA